MKVDYIQHCGSDLSVVNAARVSFDKESDFISDNQLADKDKKLIKYLSDHDHTSPFNHAFLTVRVKAPIFVARQLVKHKFMPWNEISRRYVDSPPEFYNPSPLRQRAEDKKQGSSSDTVEYSLNPAYQYAYQCYTNMLADGVCPEQARMVLPQSMYTSYYVTGSLSAFARAYKLRIDKHAQKEIQELAESWNNIIKDLFPVSWKALINEE